MADDEEVVEDEGAEEAEEQGGGRAFVAPDAAKPKSDAFTVLLVLSFVAFLTGIVLAGMELHEYYDVQFWVFSKQ